MIRSDHPFYFLKNIFAKEDAYLYLSKYVYRRDSLFDERENIKIAMSDISEKWLNETISQLEPNNELALHSKVTIKRKTFHIPMIDFAYKGNILDKIDRIENFLPIKIKKSLAFFKSGRSFHAYSTLLLGPKDWYDFMGRLLLINKLNEEQIIDTRWIGHRLIGGYCSLRWSNNTSQYLDIPRRVNIMIKNSPDKSGRQIDWKRKIKISRVN